MWSIVEIEELEQIEGQLESVEMVVITIENDFGQQQQLEVAKDWISFQEYEIGDEWEEDISLEEKMDTCMRQSTWMSQYLDAIEEYEEGFVLVDGR